MTPSGATQYSNGLRGKKRTESERERQIVDALAERAVQRINANMNPLSTAELLDAAHQIIAVTRGETMLTTNTPTKPTKKKLWILGLGLDRRLEPSTKQTFGLLSACN